MNWKILGLIFMMLLPLYSCKTIEYVPIEPVPPILPEMVDTLALEGFSFKEIYILIDDIEVAKLIYEAERMFTVNTYIAFAQELKYKMLYIKIEQITKVIDEAEYLKKYNKYEEILNKLNASIFKLKKIPLSTDNGIPK